MKRKRWQWRPRSKVYRTIPTRRVENRVDRSNSSSLRVERLSVFLNSALTLGLLLVAVAQWRVARTQTGIFSKQTEIANSLRKLEFSRSATPKIEFKPSPAQVEIGSGAGGFKLPKAISVSPLAGVSRIKWIDIDVGLQVSSASSGTCSIAARGLYSYENRKLETIEDPQKSLDTFVKSLQSAKLAAAYPHFEG